VHVSPQFSIAYFLATSLRLSLVSGSFIAVDKLAGLRGPGATVNYRPVLSSERALQNKKQ
jgi:hypothetical protein